MPVAFNEASGCRAQLVGDFAERSRTIVEPLDFLPRATLDRFDELSVPALDTQELCVRLRSVETILGSR